MSSAVFLREDQICSDDFAHGFPLPHRPWVGTRGAMRSPAAEKCTMPAMSLEPTTPAEVGPKSTAKQ
ncbi:hypothetical protein GE061_009936 [Apolygus lucorum]|uniref:Uncharacterized protein n=1 Tax=Apolygus lucorum TaxID=248454 RepID=A0A8S9Y2Y5_APOLU|nr:hypothetical protein GE061_009936 [Apolygus lucorum]